jgi:peptidoglycan/LPS O-acetylase OafA/YrhL
VTKLTNRRTDIDGLRAVAVIGVLFFHAKCSTFAGGFVGVDVFFVISGFVITQTILRNIKDNRFSFLEFYARRARRLLPALAIVLLATVVVGGFVLWPVDYRALSEQAIASTLFVPNLLFWNETGYFDSSADLKPLLHLWSLGIEEQFYLVWPLIIFSLARYRRLHAFLVLTTLASFFYCAHLTRIDQTAAFYSPLTRYWELSLGGSMATIGLRRTSAYIRSLVFLGGLIAISSAFLMFHADALFPGYRVALPTLGAAAIIWSGPDNSIAKYTLSLRFVVYVGMISYPLYLWHWPVLSLSRQAGLEWHPLLLLVLSAILAIVAFELVERRIQMCAPTAVWKPLWTCMAAIAGVSTAIVTSNGLYMRYPADVVPIVKMKEYDYGKDARLHVCWREPGKDNPIFPLECSSPSLSGAILIVGDSHAARLYPGIKRAFDHRPVWQVTQSSCIPSGRDPACARAMEYALKIASEKAPEYIIIFAAWPNYTTDWSEATQASTSLSSALDKFVRTGAEVIVLGPAPKWKPELPIVAYNAKAKLGHVPLREKSVLPVVGAIDQQMKIIAQRKGAKFFSVNDLLCNNDGCLIHPPKRPDELMTWDYGHLTTAGAEYVSQHLTSQLIIPRSKSMATGN